MITLQRLNMDSSWCIRFGSVRFLLDPWLVGSEIDGAPWLNEQWHVTEPVAIQELPPYDFIVISQSYSDHCHIPTLRQLPPKPILATRKAFRRLRKELTGFDLHEIGNKYTPLPSADSNFRIQALDPRTRRDPVYFGLHLNDGSSQLLYVPHGFRLTDAHKRQVQSHQIDVLLTTFSTFRLPGLMGGLVNPGLEGVRDLCDVLHPGTVINTHDEQKQMKGLVARLAKTHYPDLEKISAIDAVPFLHIPDYQPVTIQLKQRT